ncbi:hypothetical protein JK628_02920 [Shewanella sp. KX20019]|uniref:hypothetical protein n=1 Tax=Shewanella sp. KX20019 TaxID=2803864 RepID=UPI0019253D9F|nr:hypothetical protein [Shewanella sp. KX20019]QQX80842.1 hypothetical protein JK628_02920 [Shewanella sp. KX20019]
MKYSDLMRFVEDDSQADFFITEHPIDWAKAGLVSKERFAFSIGIKVINPNASTELLFQAFKRSSQAKKLTKFYKEYPAGDSTIIIFEKEDFLNSGF